MAFAGQREEMGQAELLVRVRHVVEMVGEAGAVFERGLGRADVHAPVDLAAVDVDDLAAVTPGQLQGQCAFADAGGANDGQEGIYARRGAAVLVSVHAHNATAGATAPGRCSPSPEP